MVIIPIEVKKRELLSRVLVAKELLNNNISVLFGSERVLSYLFEDLRDAVYFDKSISVNKVHKYKRFIDKGGDIFSIDEEGLSSITNKSGYLDKRVSVGTLKLVNKIFFWGKNDYEITAEAYPKYKSKFICSGNPRIDILTKNQVQINYSNSIFFKNKTKKRFAIMSNFTVNHSASDNLFWNKLYDLGRIQNDDDLVRYRKILDAEKTEFVSFKKMIEFLCKSFKEYEFIIRPHPSEDYQFWNDFAEKYNNLDVDNSDDSALPLMASSDYVIHQSCTTGLESSILGVPTIAYIPNSTLEKTKHISNKLSFKVYNLEELKLIIDQSNFTNTYDLDPNNYFSNYANRDSFKIISNEIISKSKSKSLMNDNINFSIIKKLKFNFTNTYLYSMLFNTDWLAYEKRKFSGLTYDELRNLLGDNNIIIKRVCDDLFLLKSNK